MSASALRRRALLSGSMLVAAVVGYGRRAYAACVNSGGSTYQCSGANATTQTIFQNNATVSTLPGFSVNTATGNGITISGAGAISYTDIHASPVTAYFAALYVRGGSVTINSNGALSAAYFGINARSYGTGAITITANGNVGTTGVGGYSGIYARNSTSGNDITVTTATGTTVSGRQYGINARNDGTGAITIAANGDVTGGVINAVNRSGTSTSITETTAAGTTVSGIYASNYGTGATTVTANGNVTGSGIHAFNISSTNSSNVTVTTAAGTTVSGIHGGNYGIWAGNYGHGVLTITANGDVTGNDSGIRASTGAGAAGLSVTTAAGTTVGGNGLYGIDVRNRGTGVVSITTNGDVTGANGGIVAINYGAASILSVTTGASTRVSGGRYGIFARNIGTGALTITANGNVTGTGGIGIYAINFPGAGTDLNVTTGPGTTVSGATLGIRARNYGTGALTITANGDVTGMSSNGIDAQNSAAGTNLSVTTGAGATVTGHYNGIQARNNNASALTITANGHVTGAQDGIYAASTGGAIAITVAATGAVSSTGTGATQFAIETKGGPATVTVAGTLNGGAGGAVQFDQATAFANRLALQTGAVINGNVLGGTGIDTLALSGTGSGSFNVGQLVAFEAGEKTEAGNWTLTGTNTGITTFSVGGGTLVVNGSLSNAAFTVTAGVLAGTGTVGNVSVAAGGTFAPGSGVAGSSMTVSGNLAFQSGALYLVQVSPASASSANVGGTATLTGGSVQAVFAPGSYVARSWDILHASGGRIGTLSSLSSNLGAGFSESLSYTATDVFLNLTATLGVGGGLNQNQQNVAGAINGYFNNGGALPPNFLPVFGLTGANLGNALTLLSGQASTGAQQGAFQLGNQFLGIMLDPSLDGRGGVGIGGPATGFAPERAALPEDIALAYAKVMKAPASNATPVTFEQRWTAWAGAFGGTNKTSGDPLVVGSHDLTARAGGVASGLDYHVSPDAVLGFALAGGGTKWDLAQGLGGGKSDAFQAGVYGVARSGPAYVAAALAFAEHWTSTDRFAALADHLTASFNAQSVGGRIETGYRFGVAATGIAPYAALQAQSFRTPTYAEVDLTGGGFGLAFNGRTATDTRSEMGARFDHVAPITATAVVTLRGRLAWAHDWITDPSLTAVFQALPGASFIVNGAAQAKDAALASAGAEVRLANGVSFLAKFDGEFAGRSNTYAGTGTVRVAW